MTKRKNNTTKNIAGRLRSGVIGVLSGTFLGRDQVLRHLPFVLFLAVVSIIYISYGYRAEATVKRMYILESEVKDLKTHELTVKSDLEKIKQQSHVAEAIQEMGLEESVAQPYKIEVSE